jgi:phosphocarrier protein FPr
VQHGRHKEDEGVVGIVIVSHSARIAEGVVELARQMAGPDVAIEAAGGIDDADNPIGTDAARVLAAIERASGAEGVLVLMDLGSAVLSAELARSMLDPAIAEGVLLCEAPLVEGAVTAAVAARVGGSLTDVAGEARRGLQPKIAQLGGPQAAPAQPTALSGGDDWTEARLTITNPLGLHARPAARFVQTAADFDAEVLATNLTTGAGPARARSLTDVATLGAAQGHELLIRARGRKAQEALVALTALAQRNFDEKESQFPSASAQLPNKPPLGMQFDGTLRGLAAAPGSAVGRARRLRRGPLKARAQGDVTSEQSALTAAIERATSEVRVARDVVARQAGEEHAQMMDAQIALLGDAALLEPARAAIAEGARAEVAWQDAVAQAADRFAALDDEYLRARGEDVRELGRRIIGHLSGMGATIMLRGPGILVARELGAAETAGLDLSMVTGIAVATGSPTSHSAILARALGVPAVVGAGDGLLTIPEETVLLIDGDAGTITIEPDEATVMSFEARHEEQERDRVAARDDAAEPAITRDGVGVEVSANIARPEDVARALEYGADGIGLFRTEFLFMGRDAAPGEDEQADAYGIVARTLGGRPLILRTLDAGADKPVDYLAQEPEENPFLGRRGIRLGLANPDVLRTQLRAALRVAAGGHPLSIMFPMIATVAEFREARGHLDAVRAELMSAGVRVPADIPVGVMIEVPSAAIGAATLAKEAAFLSVGTNDLTQYVMAAERGNPAVADLGDSAHPAVLRLIQLACEAALSHGRWIGVCGEAAGDADIVPILVGLGVRELSVPAPRVPEVKRIVRSLDTGKAAILAGEALTREDAAAVREIVRRHQIS